MAGIAQEWKKLPPVARYGLLVVLGVGGLFVYRKHSTTAPTPATTTLPPGVQQMPDLGSGGGIGGGGAMGPLGAALPPNALPVSAPIWLPTQPALGGSFADRQAVTAALYPQPNSVNPGSLAGRAINGGLGVGNGAPPTRAMALYSARP